MSKRQGHNFQRLRRPAGEHTGRVHRASAQSRFLWDYSVAGITSGNLHGLQTAAAKCSVGVRRLGSTALRFSCAAATSHLDHKPKYFGLVVQGWATAVWEAVPHIRVLQVVLEETIRRRLEGRLSWRRATSPGDAHLDACVRIGWHPLDARRFVDQDGVARDMLRLSPGAFRVLDEAAGKQACETSSLRRGLWMGASL